MNTAEKDDELLANIQTHWEELAQLLNELNLDRNYENLIYRFYRHSYKVYRLQDETRQIVEALKKIAPAGTTFCHDFEEICQAAASGKELESGHNQPLEAHTRVFAEAFFHAKFFLEMAVKYGKELEAAPSALPFGWAALLCLYNLR